MRRGGGGRPDIDYPEKRWVQFLILRVLYERPSYGYEVVKSIKSLTGGRHQIKLGTAYTLLGRMERNGLLVSRWERSRQLPDKKIYQVTKEGERLLKMWLEVVIDRKRMMDKMIKFYKKHFGRKDR